MPNQAAELLFSFSAFLYTERQTSLQSVEKMIFNNRKRNIPLEHNLVDKAE